MEIFGRQCVVVAIDAKRNYNLKDNVNVFSDNGKKFWYEIFIFGGKKETGIDAIAWAKKAQELGAGEILLTSIDKDGTKDGYDISLTRAISDAVEVPVIASGGVGHPRHMSEGIINGHASAVLAASIFHFGEFSIRESKEMMQQNGVPVRL